MVTEVKWKIRIHWCSQGEFCYQ